jgi:hypothetical protein
MPGHALISSYLSGPALSWPLAAAIAASFTRITLTLTALPRIAAT